MGSPNVNDGVKLVNNAKLKAGGANPFIDPAGYHAFIEDMHRSFQNNLQRQRAGK